VSRHACIAIALQLVGICQHLLQIANDHAQQRHQFGRPIGSFQAVQHLLASAAVDIAAATHAAENASANLDTRSSGLASLVAAGTASRAFVTTSRAAQQVLGAIGYTLEHEFHRYLERGLVLSQLIASNKIDEVVGRAARDMDFPSVGPVGESSRTIQGTSS
jgi:alkylation response protein AidB-like acyl-CoA dehydrogenase